jgi:mannose-6-phosphate isomerase-like protein (cupin superfamily)
VSYSIKNLRDVEDAAVAGGLSDVQEAHFAGKELEARDTGLSFQVLKPGKRHAFAHRHHEAEEIFVVLSGRGRVKLDDDVVDVGPLDAIRVAPAVTRAFEAGPDGLELLVFGPHHAGDAEPVRDFW